MSASGSHTSQDRAVGKASQECCVVKDDGTAVGDVLEDKAATQNRIDEHAPESIFPDQLLWPEEIAAELGLKPETLTAWRSMGKGPPYLKTGRFVRYTRPDYVRWLKTRRQQPVAAQARRSERVA